MAISPLKLLFSQQTVCCEQEFPPIPMTESGEQVRPMGTAAPPRWIPSNPRSALTTELVEDWTELQHWREPVEHWLGVPEGLLRATLVGDLTVGGIGGRPRASRSALVSLLGRAAAKVAKRTTTEKKMLANFMMMR